MSSHPILTRNDRAYRREKVVAAYQRGASSYTVASMFGLSDRYVRDVVSRAGVARKWGRSAS